MKYYHELDCDGLPGKPPLGRVCRARQADRGQSRETGCQRPQSGPRVRESLARDIHTSILFVMSSTSFFNLGLTGSSLVESGWTDIMGSTLLRSVTFCLCIFFVRDHDLVILLRAMDMA
jgi:hypothetical protein